MCYGNPQKLLRQWLLARGLVRNALGHTCLDDFDHFCAVNGLSEAGVGADAFAWAKLAYVTAWRPIAVSSDSSAATGTPDPNYYARAR